MLIKSLEAFLFWLKKLPIRHRKNVTEILINFMPNCEMTVRNISLEEFENWLRMQSLRPSKEIGAALAIKSIIEFTVIQHITHSDQWRQQLENVDALIEKWSVKSGNENKVAWLKSHRESLEFNAAQTARVRQSWIELCELHFTAEALKENLLDTEANSR